MKINIFYPLTHLPTGGANQFLKGLRDFLITKGIYEKNPKCAEVIIVNCSPLAFLKKIPSLILILLRKKVFIVARLDGPVFLIRGHDLWADKLFFCFCEKIADLVIFQSTWSKSRCLELGLNGEQTNSCTIINSADPRLFFPEREKKQLSENSKIRCIISTWSNNWRKGFEYYKWIDQNLNFENFEVIFVGNSELKFENISMLPPMNSGELATIMRTCDLYLTASQNDPCSNSLIEAMACGLFPIVLKDGGHPEIVGDLGAIFQNKNEMMEIFENIKPRLASHQNLQPLSWDATYENYCSQIDWYRQIGSKKSKKLSIFIFKYLSVLGFLTYKKFHSKIKTLIIKL